MSLRYTPLKRVGKRGAELKKIRDKQWPDILDRHGYKCAGCDQPASRVTLTYAHVFGRNGTGAGLGDWAHVPELIVPFCVTVRDRWGGCHPKFDRYLDAQLRVRIEREALRRFVKKYGGTIDPVAPPIDNIRNLVRQLETAGAVPDV